MVAGTLRAGPPPPGTVGRSVTAQYWRPDPPSDLLSVKSVVARLVEREDQLQPFLVSRLQRQRLPCMLPRAQPCTTAVRRALERGEISETVQYSVSFGKILSNQIAELRFS